MTPPPPSQVAAPARPGRRRAARIPAGALLLALMTVQAAPAQQAPAAAASAPPARPEAVTTQAEAVTEATVEDTAQPPAPSANDLRWEAQARAPWPIPVPATNLRTIRLDSAPDSLSLPAAPWQGGALPTVTAEGGVRQAAWKLPGNDTTLALIGELGDAAKLAGFTPVFACDTEACGGFDFRYAAPVLAEPDMHIDLGDFRYLLARRGAGAEAEYLAAWTSRNATAGFIQIDWLRPLPPLAPVGLPPGGAQASGALASGAPASDRTVPAPADRPDRAATVATAAADFGAGLEGAGHLALDDLQFESGSARLDEADYASLRALAAYLQGHPDRQVTLVGHSDSVGGVAANLALSRARAASVRETLVTRYGAPAAQLSADGVGPLAPRASNLTEAGRAENRRVEAILTSTQ